MTRSFRFLFAMLAAIVVPLSAPSAFACAMCRASLLNSQGGAELLEGLRQGIVFLLAFPLFIAATILIRLKRAARATAESATQQRIQAASPMEECRTR